MTETKTKWLRFWFLQPVAKNIAVDFGYFN